MSHRHSDVAPEPRAPNADTADTGPARRWDCSKDGSFSRRDRPEKTMMDCKKLREVLDAYVDREISAERAAQTENATSHGGAVALPCESFARVRQTAPTQS